MASTRWSYAGQSPTPVYQWLKQGRVPATITCRAVLAAAEGFRARATSSLMTTPARRIYFEFRSSWSSRPPPPAFFIWRAATPAPVAANRSDKPAITGSA